MPFVILDGPEAAGKSTIIDHLTLEWGFNYRLTSMGPKKSWLEYCQPLFDGLQACEQDPHHLVVWSRGWASRVVYNKLLHQGQIVPPEVTRELEDIVLRAGGYMGMVTSPVVILQERRLARIEAGEKKDHQLDVSKELWEFQKYARGRKWAHLDGTAKPEDNVRGIISALVLRNPECRMDTSLEVNRAR